MSNLTSNDVKGLMEAYTAVYENEETLESEIFESIAYALISQGYTAIDVLEYFSNVNNEVIFEDIISLSEGSLIIESVVSDDYIQEQFEILNEALPAVLPAAAAAARLIAPIATRLAPRVASLASRTSRLSKASPQALQRLQRIKSASAKPNVIQRAIGGVKDKANSLLDKLPGGKSGKLASGLKTAGKWALGGAAFEAGANAVRGLSGNKDNKDSSTSKPSSEKEKEKWNAPAAKGGKLAFAAGGGKKAMEGGKSAEEVQKKGMEALRAREKTPNTAAGFDKAFASARKLGQKAFKWQGKEYTTDLAHTNLFDVVDGGEYLGENQYEPYDIVLNYLFDNGHVDTLDEAHYVMLEMDAETIQSIVEEYQ